MYAIRSYYADVQHRSGKFGAHGFLFSQLQPAGGLGLFAAAHRCTAQYGDRPVTGEDGDRCEAGVELLALLRG